MLELVRERYRDFGPTFASEKLLEKHGHGLSAETLRKWMMEDGDVAGEGAAPRSLRSLEPGAGDEAPENSLMTAGGPCKTHPDGPWSSRVPALLRPFESRPMH